jgi:hypothetical protein
VKMPFFINPKGLDSCSSLRQNKHSFL